MTKTIEDYPELKEWFNKHHADTEYLVKEFHFGFEVQDVEEKLLEMQATIDALESEKQSLKNQLLEYEETELEVGLLETEIELSEQQNAKLKTTIDSLTEQNKRKDAFLEMHIRRWEGVESIDPSIQVLKRALGRVGESMGVPERLLNKESK